VPEREHTYDRACTSFDSRTPVSRLRLSRPPWRGRSPGAGRLMPSRSCHSSRQPD